MLDTLFTFFEKIINPFSVKDLSFQSQKPTLWILIRKIKTVVVVIAIAGLLKSIVDVGVIYVVGLVIDSLNGTLTSLVKGLISQDHLFILAGFLFFFIRPAISLLMGLLCDQCIRAKFSPLVRWLLYLKTTNNDLSFFNQSHAGKISSAVWQSGQAATEFLLSTLQIIWSNIAYIVLMIGFMSVINYGFSVIIITWLIIYTLISLHFAPEIKRRSRRSADASNVINGHLVDIFSNIVNVKSLSPYGDEREFVKNLLSDFINKSQSFLRAVTCAETLLIITSSAAMVAIGYMCITCWDAGILSVGEISIVFGLVFRLESQLSTLMNQLTGAMRSIGLFNAAIDTLHHENQLSYALNTTRLPIVNGDICLENVVFGYEENKLVLDRLNIHVRQGEKIAIVGESGAGKSTLINLLLRFYDPLGGTITLDGIDIRTIPVDDLRAQFSLVTQDNMLFNRTIYENVTFGCNGVTQDEVVAAARKARAIDFINKASDGINNGFSTRVGDRGVKLSGGQRQRLSICRAILRDAPVLILDEATSALDSATESDIRDSLDEVMQGKTVICIAHRLSTIINMDRIIVLGRGEILEEGTHDELVNKGSHYYSLWKQQANL